MKKNLSLKELTVISSMLFGLFFGAGNLIFPVHLGQMAGSNVWPAALGFIITGVGIPILGVAAIGITKSNGLQDLANRVDKRYSVFFTCLLYLTIGPFFAIPRCATVPFEMGIGPMMGASEALALALYTGIFFTVVLFFSLRPQGIMVWIGKLLNPVFLVFLGILVAAAFISPMADSISAIHPDPTYTSGVVVKGFLEGYNTMDAMAGLAFGIIIVRAVKDLGISEPRAIAANTVKAGVFSGAIMAVIYVFIMLIGTTSRGCFELSENGSIALAQISGYYFGTFGTLFLACIATFACLKTAIGLVTSCSATFVEIFPDGPSYTKWCVGLTMFSFMVANIGLTALIEYAIPFLMFLYPLSITLIFTALAGSLYHHSSKVYKSVAAFTFFAALLDFIHALPTWMGHTSLVQAMVGFANANIPLYSLGLGWVVPAIFGLFIGMLLNLKDIKHR